MNERIVTKIRNLLARADASRNDNANERAIALRQAQKLMDKHAIDASQISDQETPEERGRGSLATGSAVWKSIVINYVALLNGCRCFRIPGASTVVVGKETARYVVLHVSSFLIDSIERESKRLAGSGRGYIASWKKGAASGIGDTVKELLRERNNPTGPAVPGQSLAVIYDAEGKANDRWIAQNVGTLHKSKARAASNSGGFHGGRKYGRTLNVNAPLPGNGSGAKMLK